MKYLILDDNLVIFCISDTLEYHTNGNPLVHYGNVAILKDIVSDIIEVESVPDYVTIHRYCYINGEYKKNTRYIEPSVPADVRIAAIEEQLAMVDETAIELYEAQIANEEINAAQDDALIELYEMIGG